MSRRRLTLIAVGLLAILVAIGLALADLLLWGVWNNPFNDRSFDCQLWLRWRGSDEADNPRGKMAEDLRARLLRERPSRREVIQLLGEPDWGQDQSWVSYKLGYWSGLRWDIDTLDIHLDTHDRVQHVAIIQH